jgi:hypothetical protein
MSAVLVSGLQVIGLHPVAANDLAATSEADNGITSIVPFINSLPALYTKLREGRCLTYFGRDEPRSSGFKITSEGTSSLGNHGYLMVNREGVIYLISFMANQTSSSYAMSEPSSD